MRTLAAIALALLVAAGPARGAFPTDSLVEVWEMDGASGANNETGAFAGKVMTQAGSPGSASGPASLGTARVYSTSSMRHSSGDSAFDKTNSDFTIACWVRPNAWGPNGFGSMFYSKWNPNLAGDTEYAMDYQGSNTARRFRFQVSAGASGSGAHNATWGTNASLNTWYLVVGWHDSVNDVVGISVDAGTAVTTAHSTGVYNATHTALVLGYLYDPNESNSNSIAQAAFWDKVLTSQERSDLYNGGSGVAYSAGGAPARIFHPIVVSSLFPESTPWQPVAYGPYRLWTVR